jgi:hypothetical protein
MLLCSNNGNFRRLNTCQLEFSNYCDSIILIQKTIKQFSADWIKLIRILRSSHSYTCYVIQCVRSLTINVIVTNVDMTRWYSTGTSSNYFANTQNFEVNNDKKKGKKNSKRKYCTLSTYIILNFKLSNPSPKKGWTKSQFNWMLFNRQ